MPRHLPPSPWAGLVLALWLPAVLAAQGAAPVAPASASVAAVAAAVPLTDDQVQAETDRISALMRSKQREQALPAAQALWQRLGRERGDRDPITLQSMNLVVAVLTQIGRYPEAITLGERCLALTEAVLGPDHDDSIAILGQLGATHGMAGQQDESLDHLGRAWERVQRRGGDPGMVALGVMDDYSWILAATGRAAEALALNTRSYEARRRLHGDDHFETRFSGANLMFALAQLERFDEVDRLSARLMRGIDLDRLDDPAKLRLVFQRAVALIDLGRRPEAIPLIRAVVRQADVVVGPQHRQAISYRANALKAESLEDLPAAERALRLLEGECRSTRAAWSPPCDSITMHLGDVLAMKGDPRAALVAWAEVEAMRAPRLQAPSSRIALAAKIGAAWLEAAEPVKALAALDGAVADTDASAVALGLAASQDLIGWRDGHVNVHHLRMLALRDAGLTSRLLGASETVKARVLVEHHARSAAIALDGLPAADRDALAQARHALQRADARLRNAGNDPDGLAERARLRAELDRAQAQARAAVDAVAARHPTFARRARPATWDDRHLSALRPGELFLSVHAIDGERVWLIGADRRGQRFQRLGPRIPGLVDTVAAYGQSLAAAGANVRAPRAASDAPTRVLQHWVDPEGHPRWRFVRDVACSADELARDRERDLTSLATERRGSVPAIRIGPGSNRPGVDCRLPTAQVVDAARARDSIRDHLHRQLLVPVEQALRAARRGLIISPDSFLWTLPWDTLLPADHPRPTPLPVTLTHSLTTLHWLRARPSTPPARGRLLAFADPAYAGADVDSPAGTRGRRSEGAPTMTAASARSDSRSTTAAADADAAWPRLPWTGMEGAAVAAMFGRDRSSLLLQREASETRLRALDADGRLARFSHLLFSVHGYDDERLPGRSGIVLAPEGPARSPVPGDESHDGYVTVADLSALRLSSRLAVVSSCSSGRGQPSSTEGQMGISYALQLAGNRNALVTLWPVQDGPAAAFVIAFMRRVHAGVDDASALAQTKAEFRSRRSPSHRDPGLWAAFQLHGG